MSVQEDVDDANSNSWILHLDLCLQPFLGVTWAPARSFVNNWTFFTSYVGYYWLAIVCGQVTAVRRRHVSSVFEWRLFQRAELPPPIFNILHLKTRLFFIPLTPSRWSLCWGFTPTGIERHQETFTLFLHGFPLIAAQRCLQSQQEMPPASKASDYWKLTNNMIFSTPFEHWGLRRWKVMRTYFWDSVRH